ncbi:DsrE family protein [Oscillospiraceae bacterium PP1C4]
MDNAKELYILWTNADELTSQMMVMMYARNAMLHHWWDSVTVIIWGATAKLVAENKIIQEEMLLAKQAGVHFSACIACAINLGVRENLESLGVEVIPWGQGLTQLIQDKCNLITI